MWRVPTYETLLVDIDEGVVTVTLNRPQKKNAMNPVMHQEMHDLLVELEGQEAVRVLVVTGAGDSFCAGQDLKEYFKDVNDDPALRRKYDRIAEEWRSRLLHLFPRPTIAKVNGYCFGGAFSIVAACDIAVADEEAVFGLSEVNWGAIPGGQVSRVITELMSYRDALYFALTAEPFSGRQAADMRLVTKAVPGAELDATVDELARRLAGMDADALQATKEAIKVLPGMSQDQAGWWLRSKSEALRLRRAAQNTNDGIDGFLNKEYRPGFDSHTGKKPGP